MIDCPKCKCEFCIIEMFDGKVYIYTCMSCGFEKRSKVPLFD